MEAKKTPRKTRVIKAGGSFPRIGNCKTGMKFRVTRRGARRRILVCSTRFFACRHRVPLAFPGCLRSAVAGAEDRLKPPGPIQRKGCAQESCPKKQTFTHL